MLFLIPCDSNILNEYKILLNELKKYNPELIDKERILLLANQDLLDEELKKELKELPENIPTLFISSIASSGLTELKDLIWKN